MSEADEPTLAIKPVTLAGDEGGASPILDADATFDTSGNASPVPSTVSGATRTTINSKFMGPID
ncbi:MAG: hypothetical protein WCA38_16485 [Candidatus Acidiferrales bacterium]